MTSASTNKSQLFHWRWPCVCGLAALAIATCASCNRGPAGSTSADSATGTATTTKVQPAKNIDLKKPVVTIETNQGTITVCLDGVRAPGTVSNFLNYVNDGFYDNTLVHYVDAGKMIVAGGYSTDRKPKSARTPIRNEAHNGLKNTRGTIAMARDPSRIDSATSQFFINLADAPQRDHTGDTADSYGYCVFGEVTEGLNTAEKISRSSTKEQEGDFRQTPNPPVIIKSVRAVQ
jgi:cyclophilin family peptidyl-prolyl cis-trans isomerase